jgi:hypothetical protein
MKKLGKIFFCRLFIVIGFVAAVGFCIQPTLAQGLDEMLPTPDAATPLGDELDSEVWEEAFGGNIQATWITAQEFVPSAQGTVYREVVDGSKYTVGGSGVFVAPIRLPSGAVLLYANLWGYDNDSADICFTLLRMRWENSPENLGDCSKCSYGTPGQFALTCTPNTIIANRDNWYRALILVSSAAAANHRFWGVRLIWQRQIRTGLSHPFTDIGSLPAEFQNSIAALAASGITTGTTPTTFSPNNPVTRAQMAVFLARALGLHWDAKDGY